jgi:hypothetical protein
MSVKSVNATFNTNDGIMLPGYANRTNLLGMDDNWSAPGLILFLEDTKKEIC